MPKIKNSLTLAIAVIAILVTLVYLALISAPDKPHTEPSASPTKDKPSVSNPLPKVVESNASADERGKIVEEAHQDSQELSPEMRKAINEFVGKGKAEPKVIKLKEGGNIARLNGRYRHVNVITIDGAGNKKLVEYGPHGVPEEE